jgi:hypothetical protein
MFVFNPAPPIMDSDDLIHTFSDDRVCLHYELGEGDYVLFLSPLPPLWIVMTWFKLSVMIEYVYITNWGRRIVFVFKPAPSIMDSDDLIQTLSDDRVCLHYESGEGDYVCF